jgi:cation:H+ antiporter
MSSISPYLLFFLTALIVVIAASRLAKYADIIAVRTSFGGLIVGTILLAGATSLPEFIASISSFRQGVPDLAAGNFLGSNMVNIVLLAIIDVLHYQVPLLRTVALTHTLTALLGILLMTLVAIFTLGGFDVAIGWVGLDSLLIVAFYFGGVWLVQQEGKAAIGLTDGQIVVPAGHFPPLRRGVIGFLLASAVLLLVVPLLVRATTDIAALTGIGATFIGTTALSLVTSLPELLAAWAAVRIGSPELAVGNLFGSSVFNMLGLGIADFFYTPGRLLGAIDPSFSLVALLGVLLTGMAMLGTLARLERRLFFIEVDALLIIATYAAGMYLLFMRGMAG